MQSVDAQELCTRQAAALVEYEGDDQHVVDKYKLVNATPLHIAAEEDSEAMMIFLLKLFHITDERQ